jgi:hypothetical protein
VAGAVWAAAKAGPFANGSIGEWLAQLFSGMTSLPTWLRALARKDTPDTTAIAELNVTGGTYAPATDSLEAASEALALVIPGQEPTGFPVTVTVTVNGSPVLDACVTLQTAGGQTTYCTDASGVADQFVRPAGSYTLSIPGSGSYADYTGTVVVSSAGIVTGNTVALTAITIPSAPSDSYLIYGIEDALDGNGRAGAADVTVTVVACDDSAMTTAADGTLRRLLGTEYPTDASGLWSFSIAKSAVESGGSITIQREWEDAAGNSPKEKQWAVMDSTKANASDQIAWSAWGPHKGR